MRRRFFSAEKKSINPKNREPKAKKKWKKFWQCFKTNTEERSTSSDFFAFLLFFYDAEVLFSSINNITPIYESAKGGINELACSSAHWTTGRNGRVDESWHSTGSEGLIYLAGLHKPTVIYEQRVWSRSELIPEQQYQWSAEPVVRELVVPKNITSHLSEEDP